MDQVQHPCECHMCNQGNGDGSTSGLNSTCLPTSRLHAGGHQFFSEKTAAHPALHLYPHIHGHLPLHNLSHLPRPLLPTLYSTPPLTHSKVRSTHVHRKFSAFPLKVAWLNLLLFFQPQGGWLVPKIIKIILKKAQVQNFPFPFHIIDCCLSSNVAMSP